MAVNQSYSQLKEKMELAFREGQVRAVRLMLRQLNSKKVPREHLVDFASLARRAQMPKLSLQLLSKIVNQELPGEKPPTALEMATYGMSLVKVGAFEEAEGLLKQAAQKQSREGLLYLAFTYIYQWNYAAAAKLLRDYLKISELGLYQQMTAKLNLASCYVYLESFANAREILAEIRSVAREKDWRVIEAGACELSAIASVSERDFASSEEYLLRATELSSAHGINDLFLRKWQAIASLLKEGPSDVNLARMKEVRQLAFSSGHWETVRDCDRYMGIEKKDSSLVTKVFFGTPFESYRNRVLAQTSDWLKVPSSYSWSMLDEKGADCFDLGSGLANGRSVLKLGSKPHLLLLALASDFYRPHLPGYLHARIHPGEIYNSETSWIRIFRLVERTRELLSESGLPLQIELRSGEFRLQATGPVELIVAPEERKSFARDDQAAEILGRLREEFSYKAFSARQAAQAVKLPVDVVRDALGQAIHKNRVLKIGERRSTLYRFSNAGQRKSAA